MEQINETAWYDGWVKPGYLVQICQLPYSVNEIQDVFDISFTEYVEPGLGLCFSAYVSIENKKCMLTGYMDKTDKEASVLVQIRNIETNLLDFIDAICRGFNIKKESLTWCKPDL